MYYYYYTCCGVLAFDVRGIIIGHIGRHLRNAVVSRSASSSLLLMNVIIGALHAMHAMQQCYKS